MRVIAILALVPFAAAGLVWNASEVDKKEFDYIIAGGGLAGLTVASRLSEDPKVSVLVIEAGGDSRGNDKVWDPFAYSQAFGDDELMWHWPTKNGKGMMGGKTLGGSTAINGMAYTRGEKVQYDTLATFLGGDDHGGKWNWNGMFAAMKKAEGFTAPNDYQKQHGASSKPENHGTDGPLKVSYPEKMYGDELKFFKQVVSTNFSVPASDDADGGSAAVVAFHPNMIDKDDKYLRSSAATAYFNPAEDRDNLKILMQNRVTKILVNGKDDNVVATGLEFGQKGKLFSAKAKKDVILAAGAIMTPTILQLSGIGDRALLDRLDINITVDLPGVGKNLQEQTMSVIGNTRKNDDDIQSITGVIAYPDIKALFGDKAGEVGKEMKDNVEQYAADAAAAGAVVDTDAGQFLFKTQAELMADKGVGLVELFFDDGYPEKGYGVDVWQLLPFSRGSVNITSSDPFEDDNLSLDPRYFEADVDMTIQIEGARMSRNLFKAAPLKNLVSGENQPAAAVPDNKDGGSDDDWEKWIQDEYMTVNHPIGTCSMMLEKYGGVVDGNLRVYHTKNLRVIDASILPHQLSAHLSATLYGVAENAADIIKSGK